jgi:hypothetical protein
MCQSKSDNVVVSRWHAAAKGFREDRVVDRMGKASQLHLELNCWKIGAGCGSMGPSELLANHGLTN